LEQIRLKPCGDGLKPACADALSPAATMTGADLLVQSLFDAGVRMMGPGARFSRGLLLAGGVALVPATVQTLLAHYARAVAEPAGEE
jgi:hypothetical protein